MRYIFLFVLLTTVGWAQNGDWIQDTLEWRVIKEDLSIHESCFEDTGFYVKSAIDRCEHEWIYSSCSSGKNFDGCDSHLPYDEQTSGRICRKCYKIEKVKRISIRGYLE